MNKRMRDAINDSLNAGRYYFTKDTMKFWGSKVEAGMYGNDTFVTSENNYDGSKRLYSARHYDWENHEVNTIGEFQQFESLEDAIEFAIKYLP